MADGSDGLERTARQHQRYGSVNLLFQTSFEDSSLLLLLAHQSIRGFAFMRYITPRLTLTLTLYISDFNIVVFPQRIKQSQHEIWQDDTQVHFKSRWRLKLWFFYNTKWQRFKQSPATTFCRTTHWPTMNPVVSWKFVENHNLMLISYGGSSNG